MKRSQINSAYYAAKACFAAHHWILPPNPRWDITDFGLGDFDHQGLVLVNLTDEPEYCEKLMYARQGQWTPAHAHHKKKEDIIVRIGGLQIQLWNAPPKEAEPDVVIKVSINGTPKKLPNGTVLNLVAGERITLVPGIYHAFVPTTAECIIGEVSTANDDLNDNFFCDPNVGRYSSIEEDEAPLVKLLSEV